MQEYTVRAPTRIDLAGGTLDLWPIHRMLTHAATVNVAISLIASTTVRLLSATSDYVIKSADQQINIHGDFNQVIAAKPLPLHRLMLRTIWSPELPPLELSTHGQSPQGAGLGGSSSLAITMVKALSQLKHVLTGTAVPSEAGLVAIAQDIEATCLVTPTGIQDYWGAVNGGVSVISYPLGGPTIEKYGIALLPQLAEELIICYSGKSRPSGINNWQIYKGVMEGNVSLISLLEGIGFHSVEVAKALVKGEWGELLKHSAAEWQIRSKLSEGIETAETRRIHQAALASGAYFTRICGAGGGGVMAIFAPREKRMQVTEAAREAGGSVLAAALTDQGAWLDTPTP